MADKSPAAGAEVGPEVSEEPTRPPASTAVARGAEAEPVVVDEPEVASSDEPAVQEEEPAAQAAVPAADKAAAVSRPAATKAPAASRPARPKPEPAAASEPRTGRRKVREGTVVSNAMEKTAVVVVIERVRHPRYAKTVQRTKRLYAHDEANDVRVGDRVRLRETRPTSKLKRWRVERVLERAR